jgi:hypothetical protein
MSGQDDRFEVGFSDHAAQLLKIAPESKSTIDIRQMRAGKIVLMRHVGVARNFYILCSL